MDEATRRNPGELSPFDIADWLWSFRWLAGGLILLAAVWTAVLLWTSSSSGPSAPPSYQLVINLYTSGTPVRSVPEIAYIYEARLISPKLWLTSAPGANPVVLHSDSKALAEAAAIQAEEIGAELIAEVRNHMNALAPYMQRDDVSEFVVGQFLKNMAFLQGADSGLTDISRTTINEFIPGRPDSRTNLLLPWLACGVAFLVLAGVVTFVSTWRTRRQRASTS
jgi:hypothetical protein